MASALPKSRSMVRGTVSELQVSFAVRLFSALADVISAASAMSSSERARLMAMADWMAVFSSTFVLSVSRSSSMVEP